MGTVSAARPASRRATLPPRQDRPIWKPVLFRVAAVALGLLPFVAGELALRSCGIGKPSDSDDPFVGFSDIHPLFVLDKPAGRYSIPKARQSHFQPESFPAQKRDNEFRIFVLGGSTVQGRPWSIETSFTTWLELHLNARDPSRHYEVVNCGGVSYSSYRLAPILIEVLQYQPDAIIYCEGHNEFLEDRSYAPIKSQNAALTWAQQRAARLHTYNLLRDSALRATAGWKRLASNTKSLLGPEVDARLDWKGGMDEYHRDPQWQADVISHMEFNLRRMVRIAAAAKVPFIFLSPVSNLQYAPFKSEHRADMTDAEIEEFRSLIEQASDLYASDWSQALGLLEFAAAIDDEYAQVHYEMGTCLLQMGMPTEARDELLKAKELDICPLRMLEPEKEVIDRVAQETGTPLVDAEALVAASSRSGFPDQQWMIDHVHPTISGHQLLADALAEKFSELGLVRFEPGREPACDTAYRQHMASLDHVYFQRGKDRLRSEQGWAHGLAPAIRKK